MHFQRAITTKQDKNVLGYYGTIGVREGSVGPPLPTSHMDDICANLVLKIMHVRGHRICSSP